LVKRTERRRQIDCEIGVEGLTHIDRVGRTNIEDEASHKSQHFDFVVFHVCFVPLGLIYEFLARKNIRFFQAFT